MCGGGGGGGGESNPIKDGELTIRLLEYNVGPTSKTFCRRCVNVIQMFCVCWVCTGCRPIVIVAFRPIYFICGGGGGESTTIQDGELTI